MTAAKTMRAALREKGKEVKSISMSDMLSESMQNNANANKIDNRKGANAKGRGKKAKKKDRKAAAKKVTAADIDDINRDIVHTAREPSARCKQLIQHNRIQQAMGKGLISDDNSLSYLLKFFEKSRQQELEQKSQFRSKVDVRGKELADNFDTAFFDDYFKKK